MLADLKKYPHLRHYTDLKAAADAALYELTGAISDRQREMSDLRANFVDIAPLAVRDAAVLQRYAEARTKADTIGHMLDDLKPAVRAAERAVESAAKELGRAIDGADRHVAAMAREAEDARPDGRPVVYAQAMSAYLKRTGGTAVTALPNH